MTHQEVLLVLAQVSVSLAGFAGLVATLGVFATNEQRLAAARVRAIAENGLIVLPFALLPLFVLGFGIETEAAFRGASAFFLLGYGGYFYMVISRFIALAKKGEYAFVLRSWIGIGFSVSALLVAVTNLFGGFGSHAASGYLLGLVGPLYNCVLAFFNLLASVSIRADHGAR